MRSGFRDVRHVTERLKHQLLCFTFFRLIIAPDICLVLNFFLSSPLSVVISMIIQVSVWLIDIDWNLKHWNIGIACTTLLLFLYLTVALSPIVFYMYVDVCSQRGCSICHHLLLSLSFSLCLDIHSIIF